MKHWLDSKIPDIYIDPSPSRGRSRLLVLDRPHTFDHRSAVSRCLAGSISGSVSMLINNDSILDEL